MLSVYKSFHQRSNMAGKEIIYYKISLGMKFKISMKAITTEN